MQSSNSIRKSGQRSILESIFPADELRRMDSVVRLAKCKALASSLVDKNQDPLLTIELAELRAELRLAHARAISQFVLGDQPASALTPGNASDDSAPSHEKPALWAIIIKKVLPWTR